MNRKVILVFILLHLLCVSTSYSHPIKISSSLVEYNSEKTHISLECRVFIDDFEKAIDRTNLLGSNFSKEVIAEIECYFEDFYDMSINGEKLYLDYQSSEVFGENSVLSLKFLVKDTLISKGDILLIENTLFFDQFGPFQSNKMTVRIPPFFEESYHETTVKNYSVNYQF